jgi:hypothetical protein
MMRAVQCRGVKKMGPQVRCETPGLPPFPKELVRVCCLGKRKSLAISGLIFCC